ncbi:MAG TPA: ATP-binding protein, partial [Fimbriimonadaceae bacterium]|nr:ATP-binding protein [Fimbriimonadaceae bacterium]
EGRRPFRVRVTPLEPGHFLIISQNLTDVTRREAELRKNEQFQRMLLDAIPDSIFHMDSEGTYLGYTSGDINRLLVRPEDFLGKKVTEVFPPDIAEMNLNSIARAIETGQMQFFTYRSPVRESYYESRVVPLNENEGISIIRDVTARKRYEDAIVAVNDELEARVAERTAELTAANLELEAFCYAASHDLRTPLRSINGFSRIILDDHYDSLPGEVVDHLERVRKATRRMDGIINDMLRLAGVVRSDLERNPISLANLCYEVAEYVDTSECVVIELDPSIEVHGDRRLLTIALENLLSNAVKFSSRRIDPHVVVGERDGTYFVRDNGVGFEQEHATRLFMAFERLHSPSEFPGNGIGLATVKRIIDRHGGRIWAESEPGNGATFYFTLSH